MQFTNLVKRFLVVCIAAAFFAIIPVKAQAAHATTLTWLPSPSTGAVYNVWKQAACTGSFTKVTPVAITGLTFVDTGMVDGELNCYYVSAVVGTSETTQAQSNIKRCVTPSDTPPTQVIVIPPVVSVKTLT